MADRWIPACDACGRSDRDSNWDMPPFLNPPHKGCNYRGYKRPFRSDHWRGYRCYECMIKHWPGLDKRLPHPRYCPRCCKAYDWK